MQFLAQMFETKSLAECVFKRWNTAAQPISLKSCPRYAENNVILGMHFREKTFNFQ